MYQGRKVVCVTPAGRKRYIDVLARYIRRDWVLIDEWHLWQNTENAADIGCLEWHGGDLLQPTVIRTVSAPGPYNAARICHFFPYACEPGTIYLRFDDDIVWVQPGAIERMLAFRLAHPEYFLVGGNIVNNPVCAHRHQRVGALVVDHKIENHYIDEIAWKYLGPEQHAQFLLQRNKDAYHFPHEQLRMNQRFGIQFISWLGDEFAKFGGKLPHEDEEKWLTAEAPGQFGKPNALCGTALAVHFAYTEQRRTLDALGTLDHYAQLALDLGR